VGSKRSARPRRTVVRGGSTLAHGKRSIFEDAMVDPYILLTILHFISAPTINVPKSASSILSFLIAVYTHLFATHAAINGK
jgi:hypothetical protein